MYRVTIVAGPNSGTTFQLLEGENSVGRGPESEVVLSSSRVSKRHCVLVASNGTLIVRDEGSANGTFVNGALVRSSEVNAGDRISVGPFILEITQQAKQRRNGSQIRRGSSIEGLPNNVISLPNGYVGNSPAYNPGFNTSAALNLGSSGSAAENAQSEPLMPNVMPTDLKGKAIWYFENFAMPIFYGLNLKHEWRILCAVMFMGFLGLNLMISVQPLLDANYNIVLNESGRRAAFMAREIAERNAPMLSAGVEGKTEIGIVETAENVNIALLMDLDQRIIAPTMKSGQFMIKGPEAVEVNKVIQKFRSGLLDHEAVGPVGENVVAVAPVKNYDPRTGKNNIIAVAVVSVDASIAAMTMGDVGVVYSETFILTALLGALMLFILYRLTLKPFQILNEDMDKVLKGEMAQVTHEFKMGELNPLWDIINSALQRIPRRNEKSESQSDELPPDVFVGPLKMMAEASGVGLVVCGPDRRISFVNASFEDLSGIRADGALGQDFGSVARDQSLGVLAADLFDRATPGGDPVSEDYDFSGVACTVQAAAFGMPGEVTPKAYVITVTRKPE